MCLLMPILYVTDEYWIWLYFKDDHSRRRRKQSGVLLQLPAILYAQLDVMCVKGWDNNRKVYYLNCVLKDRDDKHEQLAPLNTVPVRVTFGPSIDDSNRSFMAR